MHVSAAVMLRFGGESVVPFSIVPFVAFLAAFLLGPRLGAASLGIYVAMGILGLPVFARPPYGGPAYVLQPSFGFLIGFAVAAYVAGSIGNDSTCRRILAVSVGVVALYATGIPYFYAVFHLYLDRPVSLGWVLQVAFAPFVLLDLIKAYGAALIAVRIKRIMVNAGLL